MKNYIKIISLIYFNLTYCRIDDIDLINWKKSNIDVTVVGYILNSDGLGRLSIGFIENFNDKLNLNFIPTRPSELKDVNDKAIKIINNKVNDIGNVSIFFDVIKCPYGEYFKNVPDSLIKIAYSFWESDRIPEEWIKPLNEKFDAVVTACPFLVKVYKDSGVKIPIFLLPNGIYIDEFLNEPIKEKANKLFTFGCSTTLLDKKNVYKLVVAFSNKFGNNKNFKLRLHSRYSDIREKSKIVEFINKNSIKNIEIIDKILSQNEYLNFMKSLDCYVLISKGEGFSVTPRESIALGIPTIVSNNTAHEVLCQTPYFISIKSDIKVPADYSYLIMFTGKKIIGNQYDCYIKDVEDTLEYVYNNYELCLEKAKGGREWVKQYTYPALEKKYLNLVKPQKVILGDDNIITDDYLMTNSKELYHKYNILN